MDREDCDKLGESMDVDTQIEFCAGLEHNETIVYEVYEHDRKGRFDLVDEGKERKRYFGGSDACQGDSGGPM